MFNTIPHHEKHVCVFIIFKLQQIFPFDGCNKICHSTTGKYPANFTQIPDSAGCLNFTGYWYPGPAHPYSYDQVQVKKMLKG